MAASENCRSQQFMNLITYRKSGQAVRTPVWFVQDGTKLYDDGEGAGKIKRIRNNPRIVVEPSDRTGKSLGATQPAHAQVTVRDTSGRSPRHRITSTKNMAS
jgi:PPOX class probable F420-dependent enzyme